MLEITSGEILKDLSEMIDNLRIFSTRFIPLKAVMKIEVLPMNILRLKFPSIRCSTPD
jgi:hypothetical protein